MDSETSVIEIFASLQGEGPRLGEKHLFVRLQDCELSCKFCDTPLSFTENKFCRIESPPFSKKFRHLSNPMSVTQLTEILGEFTEKTLSVTGGEPLQKVPFLKIWLPLVRPRFKILLETAGVHVNEFRDVVDLIDVVSMDLKLPSVTGMHPWWREHEAFLRCALENKKEVYVKVVVSSETEEKDILRSIELISSLDYSIPYILQPASPFGRFRAIPSIEQVGHWQDRIQETLPNVRVIPQMHKALGIL